jgi:23S rRNA (guanosine2251-2'-O)-methyltransferase
VEKKMKIIGRNAVAEVIKTDKTIDKILVENGLRDVQSREIIKQAKQLGFKVQFAERAVLDKECESRRHQGFIAYTSDFVYEDFDELLKVCGDPNCFLVVADGIEDPHNLGSILRVSECAGVDAVIIGKRRSAQVNETVMRISEGSANHIDVCRVTNINVTIDELKKNNFWTYALEIGGDNIYKTNLKGRTVIVVGGEDTGVNRLTKEKCDVVITIPMKGKVNSLNASVACGVAVFEALRQRS